MTSFLVILGNFGLKLADDLLDGPYSRKRETIASLILLPLFIASVIILLDKEGMLITGTYLFTAPFRKKSDTKTFKIALCALFLTFLGVYSLSLLPIFAFLSNEHYIDLSFAAVFLYIIGAVFITSTLYERYIVQFTHPPVDSKNPLLKFFIADLTLALIPFHFFIIFLVLFQLLSQLAFVTSILSFISYAIAGILSILVLKNGKLSNIEYTNNSDSKS